MTIQERINNDLKEAIKNRDEQKKNFLRVVIAEFSRIKADDGSKNHSDEVITKELRKLEETAKLMNNDYELSVLSEYLPKRLSEDETRIIVNNIISANNITSMKEVGKFMGILKLYPEAKLVDNTTVMKLFKEKIG